MHRLSSLDYLRGLCAFSIMLYHYSLWNIGVESSSNIFTRIGIYGVSIFYILSGLTLYHVYFKDLQNPKLDLKLFYLKRILRIYPLLWLAIGLKFFFSWELPKTSLLISNLTGIFAFYSWEETITYGAWSIGNELIFYLFFPFLLYLTRKSTILFYLSLCLSLAIYSVFAFSILDTSLSYIEQWRSYTNPFNQLFLFVGGIWLGLSFKNVFISKVILWLILVVSIVTFVFYPVTGERIQLVTGFNRLIFTIAAIATCLAFYKLKFNLPKILDHSLLKLGHCSYSIYLLHPILYKIAIRLSTIWGIYVFKIPHVLILLLSIISNIFICYAIYYYFERFFTKKKRQMRILEFLQKPNFQKRKALYIEKS